MGVISIIVTPERLDPRCKRVKTDKRDARTLAMRLGSYAKGKTSAFSTVWVPTPEQEMDRPASRQRRSRCKEKRRSLKRARSLMPACGIGVPGQWWKPEPRDALRKHLPTPLAAARQFAVDLWRISTGQCTGEQLGLATIEGPAD